MIKAIVIIFLCSLNLYGQVEIVPYTIHSSVIDTALRYRNLIDIGGKKTDKNIQKFLRSVGLSGEQPYCQAFVYYCMSVNGYTDFKTGLANGYYSSLKKKYGSVNEKVANKNGLIVWKYPNSSSGHIGFIVAIPRVGWVQTIEANTSWDDTSPDGRVYAGKKGIFVKQRKIGRMGKMELRGVVQW